MRKVQLTIAFLVGLAGAVHAQPFCPGVTPWVFDDVQASDPFCGAVTWAATSNVTLGCQIIDGGHRLYCPNDLVTRKQMAVFMQRLSEFVAPLTCATGQVMKWNGLAWACANDNVGGGGGSGTVTSVLASTGLQASPNPIVGAGSINLAPSYQLPQSCANGQVPKSNGTGGWTCGTDNAGTGTVTSVAAGTGLTGGTITTTGTLAVDTAAIQSRVSGACAAGSSIRAIAANGTVTCEADDVGGSGTVTSVATGAGLTGGPITGSGTIGVDLTYLQRRVFASCAAGSSIRAIAEDGSVTCEIDDGGTTNNFVQNGNAFGAGAVLGTTDNFALDIRVNDTRIVRYEPNAISPNIIAGHPLNNVTAGVRGATIAGGGVPPGGDPDYNSEGPNRVTDIYGTVSGGYNNRAGNDGGLLVESAFATVSGGFGNIANGFASVVAGGDISIALGNWSVVGGGINNAANGQYSTVSGGAGNVSSGLASMAAGGGGVVASGDWSTVSGGATNTASGSYATVPGGRSNTASGIDSYAAGRRAQAQHAGSFVWADSSDFNFGSMATNEYAVRATGGVRYILGVDGTGAPTWTCSVAAGGSWACSSDRNLKQNLRRLDGQTVLARLAELPIYAWSPIGENAHIRHYGPTAQDFHSAFGLGDSTLRIGQQDADGVALAAIQGVNEKLDQYEAALRRELAARSAEVVELKRELAELRATQQAEVAELRRTVEVLMARTSAEGRMAQAR